MRVAMVSAALCVAGLTALGTACGSSGGEGAGASGTSGPPTETATGPDRGVSLDRSDVLLMSADYLVGYAEYQLVEARAVSLCMARAGFPTPVDPQGVPRLAEVGEPDLRWRAAHGWGLARRAGQGTPAAGEQSEAHRAALFGEEPVLVRVEDGNGLEGLASVGGCRGEAIDVAYGGLDDWDLLANAAFRVASSPETEIPEAAWAAGEARWVDCMAERGYDYVEQGNAEAVFLVRYASEGPSPELLADERRTAVDDGECLYGSGLVDARRTQVHRYLQDLEAAELAMLDAILEAHQRAVLAAPDRLAELEAELEAFDGD